VRHSLSVDDDPAIRRIVADILEMSDYVVMASKGAGALDEIQSLPWAMVLLDLTMPVTDGWEFLRHWRGDQACGGVPVAVMSAARDGGAISDELWPQDDLVIYHWGRGPSSISGPPGIPSSVSRTWSTWRMRRTLSTAA
jgi:two-component SAPR family response regulator